MNPTDLLPENATCSIFPSVTEDRATTPTRPRASRDVTSWDMETDVVIVGFGGAGACAAIEAADAGARVTLLELGSAAGGSTALSSAEIYMGGSGGTRVQRACGYEDSSKAMIDYLTLCGGPQADEAKIRCYVEGSIGHFDWLVSMGVRYKDSEYKKRAVMALTDDCLLYTSSEKAWPFADKAKPCPRGHNLEIEGDNGGPLLMKLLGERVAERPIEVHYDARALTLVTDDDGAVVGLVVRIDMQERTVRARRGVILCAGGFCMNQKMVAKYAPMLTRANLPIGNPGDMGSGILMGMGAGAAAINMHEGFVTLPYYPPSSLTYAILVNGQGQRFINEDCYHGRVGYFCLQQLDGPVYMITDEEGYGAYERVNFMGAKVAGTGDSIAELEEEIGLPVGSLEHTLGDYNAHAKSGKDPRFHKSAEWLRPIETPVVALDCTPGRGALYPFFTLGGLDTLPTGEVRTPTDEVIAGLYAAGRTTAGIPRRAQGYGSGMSVGDATFFGRLAGKSAAGRPGR